MAFRTELESWQRPEPRQGARRRCVHTQRLAIGGEIKDVAFSAISDGEAFRAAYDLINDRYAWRGYGASHRIPSDAHHTTFTAEVDRTVVGTITLGVDSELGLSIDDTFSEAAEQARRVTGAKICELTKLAFDPGIRSKAVLASLFHIAFIYGTSTSECTDLFIEVNPRHAGFYETMLGFERVGAVVTNQSVSAPSQLMRLKVDAIRRGIREHAGKADAAPGRSLYPYFFSQAQEQQVRRLLALIQTEDLCEEPAIRRAA